MDHIGRRFAAPLLTFLLNTGLTVSGFVNTTVAFFLWSLMIPTALYAVWPWIKRVRIGLKPPDTELREAKEAQKRLFSEVKKVHQERGTYLKINERLTQELREIEKECNELREINEALTIENDELIKTKSVPVEPTTQIRPAPSRDSSGIYIGNNTMTGGGTFIRNERDDINIIAEENKAIGIERFLDNANPASDPSDSTEQPDDDTDNTQ